MGAQYQRGPGWSGISGFTFTKKVIGPSYTFSGGYEVKCELSPTFKWKIADVAGPTASVGVYGKYGVTYEEECKSARNAFAQLKPSVEAGINAKIGGVVELGKFTLASFDYTLFEKKLVDAAIAPIDLGNAHSFGRCVPEPQGGAGGGGEGGASAQGGTSAQGGSGEGAQGGTSATEDPPSGGGGAPGAGFGGAGPDTCGNGQVEGIEGCDGTSFDGATCESITGFKNGALACTPDCGIDSSACVLGADCSHPTSEQGGPLLETCDACTKQLCETDKYCCYQAWDFSCVFNAQEGCGP